MEALNPDLEEFAAEQDVRAGLEALERGDFDEYDASDIQSLAADIKARGRERLASLARKSRKRISAGSG